MHLLLLLAAPYFQFEAAYLHTSLQLVVCYSQHHIVHRGSVVRSGTGNKAAANSRIAAAILVILIEQLWWVLNMLISWTALFCTQVTSSEVEIFPSFTGDPTFFIFLQHTDSSTLTPGPFLHHPRSSSLF